jgi:FG-GAP-like repeat
MRIPNLLLSIVLAVMLFGCNEMEEKNGVADSIEKGKVLANQYCQSCHLLPDPSLLDKKTWVEGILPNMGPRLGIFNYNGQNYPSSRLRPGITKNFYPDHPMLDDKAWGEIIAYYSSAAPDSMPAQKRDLLISINNTVFKAVIPSKKYDNPVSTYVGIDSLDKKIIQAEGQHRLLYVYSSKLQLTDSATTSSMIVDVIKKKNKLVLCNIGVINPNDGRYGKIQELILPQKSNKKDSIVDIFDSLRRPVEIIEADLNGDHFNDYLVCEFGNLLGALSWLENTGDGHYIRHVLRETPGAIHAIVDDYNHDGLPDLWVLFAQGDESVVLFTNKGKGIFEQSQVIRFPAVYGSTYFELADFNGDGYPDILYSAGDNADFSQILKPFHGVYIFLNDGHQHFKQAYFYPIHGCFKVMARDFDGDGDLDIAAISFFADYAKDPQEGFVYLENKGNLHFEPSTLPETTCGRWLTMDVGDLDGDGKPDIVLGNFSVGPTKLKSQQDWKKGPPFLLLKNISPKKRGK